MLAQGVLHSNTSRIPTAAINPVMSIANANFKLEAYLTKLFRATLLDNLLIRIIILYLYRSKFMLLPLPS